jgi:hypothetical protein
MQSLVMINADLKCNVIDSKTGNPIKGAVLDTTKCRKNNPDILKCGNLTDDNGEGNIRLSAPFLTKPPFVEVYKKGYWIKKFDNPWEAWRKIKDGIVFQLDECSDTQSYCTTFEMNP